MQLHLKPECEGCPNAPIMEQWANSAEATMVHLKGLDAEYEVADEGTAHCSGLNHDIPQTSLSDYCWADVRVPKINKSVFDENKAVNLGLLALKIPVEVPGPELIGKPGNYSRGMGSDSTGLALPKLS
jgi:hypothetical protein